jgi:F420-dependent oxidoreductase-like protein
MDIALMLEGQHGLTWPRWQRIAAAAEDLGFAGLYRSDHFTNAEPPDMDSLDLWPSLVWLASHTRRIEFGPLVTPVSFRHPVFTARFGRDVDDLSGGRLVLGVGAGWQEREHDHFGFDLLDVPERFARFEEGLEVITRLLHSDEPVDFHGDYYTLREAILLPRPQRRGGPPVLIGGNGPRRTLPLAVRYADEWNGVFISAEKYGALNWQLSEMLDARGRARESVRRSVMLGARPARTLAEAEERLAARGRTLDDARADGILACPLEMYAERLREYEVAGAQRVMLQWIDLDDIAGLEVLAKEVLPKFG